MSTHSSDYWIETVKKRALMDEDLHAMNQTALIGEIKKLRRAIREHRDASQHDLCWYQPALWSLLPEGFKPDPIVPEWPQFMRGCIKYRASLDKQIPNAARNEKEFAE